MTKIKEITIISGKGGTGKTSLTGSFAALSENAVFVDSDVDAANLRLILQGQLIETHEFRASKKAVINERKCSHCHTCIEVCRFHAITEQHRVNPLFCEGCGVCSHACPEAAIIMEEVISGYWYVSRTPYGKLVHARLGVAEGNSGRLVTLLRNKAKEIAKNESKSLIIIDGPPGIACPVISSLTGVTAALIVTEPTLSGIQDMFRVIDVCRHFSVPVLVCINRFDLDLDNTRNIEDFCRKNSIPVAGKIPFDRMVTEALVKKLPVVKYSQTETSQRIRDVWQQLYSLL